MKQRIQQDKLPPPWEAASLLTNSQSAFSWAHRKARLGDYAEVVRMVANMAHSAGYAADHHRSRATAKYL